jgi:2-dehydropantoate 2-reductase
LPYGALNSLDEMKVVGLAVIQEGIDVAKAKNIQLSTENAEEIWFKKSDGLPWNFKTSMHQSIEKGSKTEVDFMHGSIVREGVSVGIPTPVNSTLVACVHGIEEYNGGICDRLPETK